MSPWASTGHRTSVSPRPPRFNFNLVFSTTCRSPHLLDYLSTRRLIFSTTCQPSRLLDYLSHVFLFLLPSVYPLVLLFFSLTPSFCHPYLFPSSSSPPLCHSVIIIPLHHPPIFRSFARHRVILQASISSSPLFIIIITILVPLHCHLTSPFLHLSISPTLFLLSLMQLV
jgi:hypothetical protein